MNSLTPLQTLTHTYTLSHYCKHFAMADTSRTELRTSKRKRAQVNYYEEPASDDEVATMKDEEQEQIEEPPRAKVC